MDKINIKVKEEDAVAVRCADELLSNSLSAEGTISDGTDDSTKNITPSPSCSQKFKIEKTVVHRKELIGYVFSKLKYPMAPMVLALVLGDRAEENFRNAIKGSQGDLGIFFSNGLVGSLTGLGLFLLFWPAISALLAKMRRG